MPKKKKKTGEGGSAEAGIRVLTVALFIILLAFFIVLNSIGVEDDRHVLAALGSLTGSFGIMPGGLSASKEGEVRVLSSKQAPFSSRKQETVEIIGLDGPSAKGVEVRQLSKGEVISIQDRVLFDAGRYRIKPAAYAFLKRLSEVLNRGEYPVEISGHTDDRPGEETSTRSNWEISALRALEVAKFLVFVGHVKPSRLTAFGCGEYRPVASNEARQTRARNRRVDVALHHGSAGELDEIYEPTGSKFVVFKRFVFRVFE